LEEINPCDSAPRKVLIEVQDVYKCHRNQDGSLAYPALSGVDLTLYKGSYAVLAGRSGSGKTTLLNIIGALDRADHGRVVICGRDLSAWNEDQRSDFRLHHVGFVFQAYNLIRVLTALENVAYVCQLQGAPNSHCLDRAHYWLSQVGMGELYDRRPDQLSGGQQQRVAIARALASDPDIILADEPTANVDTLTSRGLVELFQNLNRRFGTTILVSSHDPAVIESTPLVFQMVDGQILAEGEERKPLPPLDQVCGARAGAVARSVGGWLRSRLRR
jgi:putative ABC transport system ATP-binding protein